MIHTEKVKANPLITPAMVKPSNPEMEVVGVFNAGVTTYQEETILLLRIAEKVKNQPQGHVLVPIINSKNQVEIQTLDKKALQNVLDFNDSRVIRRQHAHPKGGVAWLSTLSHFRIARSRDGIHFSIDPKPTIFPDGLYECWGIEDPRITKMDDHYCILYTSVSHIGITVSLMTTKDFLSFQRQGIVLPPENKDAVLFPEKVNGKYVMYHRPVPGGIGGLNIWSSTSLDLIHWGQHQLVLTTTDSGFENGRIGAGVPPIKTSEGWLSLYHAATSNNVYSMSAFLTSLDNPHRVIKKLNVPLISADLPFEKEGFFNHVVFACGCVHKEDTLWVYYGAADQSIALAKISLNDIMKALQPYENHKY
jgi:beta-1,2-mannobiose phosphorylase / 1,2-beta-oligomannan phosphorylase